ncbi:MAG: extracellular solute-binding protein [Chloroflexi bacterium]|nr:extracellular solute-binding protein [Chloroflexota bacterium]
MPPSETAVPTIVPTPDEPRTLVIWIPDQLLPANDETLNALLENEINEFITVEDGVQVEIRRKTSQDVGGVMSTLRAASIVAPGALPDLTLLRRGSVIDAVENGLIQPLEGRIASSVIADLFPSALRLGRAEDQLYGLPYLLDLYLYAYRDAESETPDLWTFDAVLNRGQTLAVPTIRASGMADILWLQYLAAAGGLPEDGVLELESGAVSEVLSFYEAMANSQLIAPVTFDYSAPMDYMEQLANGSVDTGIVNTAILRYLREADPPLQYAAVPTRSGEPVTLVDGWMWVIVTPNAEQQALAGRFLNWMMDSGRHGEYAQAIAMPPAQRSSLRRWQIDGIDNSLLIELLTEALPTQPEVDANNSARALQTAWLDVISGRLSAAEAARAALEP